MWFNQAIIFQYELKEQLDFNLRLSEHALKPCPPHARFIYGWSPLHEDVYAHAVFGVQLLSLGKEERILPKSVIHLALKEQISQLEMQRGYPVKRAERNQMVEELEFQLLPKSFCIQKNMRALLDETTNRLIINTSSAQQSAQFLAFLRKTIPEVHIEPVQFSTQLSTLFTQWVKDIHTLPAAFSLGSRCQLISPQNEAKRFQCRGYELPADEITTLLEQDLLVSELSLIWQDRIEFILTNDLTFKSIKALDMLQEDIEHQCADQDPTLEQDTKITILAGEWRALLKDLEAAICS